MTSALTTVHRAISQDPMGAEGRAKARQLCRPGTMDKNKGARKAHLPLL